MNRLDNKVPPLVWFLLFCGLAIVIAEISGEQLLDARWIRFGGVCLGIVGVAILAVAANGFRRAHTTVDPHGIDKASHLVTTGIYRFTRNPMYLAMLLVLIGFGSWLGSLLGVVVSAVFFWSFINRFQIEPEERVLLQKFGDDYSAFADSVPRWLSFAPTRR